MSANPSYPQGMKRFSRAVFEHGGFAVIIALAVMLMGTSAVAEEPFEITPGDSVAGRLAASIDRHCVHLALPAGARLKATLRRDDDEDLAVLLSLRGPDCGVFNIDEWLKQKVDGRQARLAHFTVPESGVWRLELQTGDFRTGSYTLVTRAQYEDRFKAEGAITAVDEETAFVFAGPAGASVNLKVKGRKSDGLLPSVLEVRGPDGLPIALPAPIGTGRKIRIKGIVLPSTGDYTVIIAAREDTMGTVTCRTRVAAPKPNRVFSSYNGPHSGCCDDGGGGGSQTQSHTISSSIIGTPPSTVPVGTTEIHALTVALYAGQSTMVSWLRLRSHGRDADVRAVRVYWDNDRFYTEADPGEQIAGGLATFTNGSLDLNVSVPLVALAPRYVHIVLDLVENLPVGREVGVRLPSGGVDITEGTWNPGSRPPHDPGPIEIVPLQTTFRWQNITQLAGDTAPDGAGHLMVRADRHLILFPSNETPFRNYYTLDLDYLGSGWKFVAAAGGLPPIRWGACGIYDPDGERLVMFGGKHGQGASLCLGDVWELDLSVSPAVWTELTPSSGDAPAARAMASAVLDTARNRMIVFGGHDSSSRVRSEAWAWDLESDRWESSALDVTGTVPWNSQGLTGHTAVYDPGHDRLIVTGGSPVSAKANEFTTMSNRTYTLELADAPDKCIWRNVVVDTGDSPPGRIRAIAAFDGVRMIVHGGALRQLTTGPADLLQDTWVLDASETTLTRWARKYPTGDDTPTARAGHVVVWDPILKSMILFAGAAPSGHSRETWLLREDEE
jgi:Kelch motif